MTDELVKRLRANTSWGDDRFAEAAARIEALTAKVAELEACLERQGSGHREDLDEIANVSVERLRRAESAEAERDRLREALAPSGATNAAYLGEFHFSQTMIGDDGNDVIVKTYVPWTTVKEIMAAILARAALKGETP